MPQPSPHKLFSFQFNSVSRLASLLIVIVSLPISVAANPSGTPPGTWSGNTWLPTPFLQPVGGLLDGKIYVADTMDDPIMEISKHQLWSLDLSTNIWDLKNLWSQARLYSAAAIIEEKLYLIGGMGFGTSLDCYDPVTDVVASKAPLPESRWSAASATANGKIYLFGGIAPTEISNSTFIYDVATDTWSTGQNMPTARAGLNAVVFNNKIYVLGGAGNLKYNVVEIYDPQTDTWTTGQGAPESFYTAASALLQGRIHIMGDPDNPRLHMSYNPATDTWTNELPLPRDRYFGLAVTVSETEFRLFGGRMRVADDPPQAVGIIDVYERTVTSVADWAVY